MYQIHASLRLFCAISLLAPLSATAVDIDTVPVGNPGNANDQNYFGQGQFGAVAYNYRIGTYEVTNAQYAEFLNSKAANDPLELYNANMGSDPRGGITQIGSSPSFSYKVKENMGNKPVNYVSFFDSIRFANWLHNGQGSGDTETGAYTLGQIGAVGVPINGPSITRNAGATWFLTSENEWYKAAYYDPRTEAQRGPPGNNNYWSYPTSSNNAPTIATASSVGDISNPGHSVANYAYGTDWNGQDGNVTTVGSAGPISDSFYGTADQGGNVWEWNEQPFNDASDRGFRGGGWNEGPGAGGGLFAGWRGDTSPTYEYSGWGFRVASVPEPSTLALAAMGLAIGLLGWKRRKGH